MTALLSAMRSTRLYLLIGAVVALGAALYAGASVVFYAWLNSANPESWPRERAALWAYGSLALTVIAVVAFIWCLLALMRRDRASRS